MTTPPLTTLAATVERQIAQIHAQRDALAAEARGVLERSRESGALDPADESLFTGIEAELGKLREQEAGLQRMLGQARTGHLGGIPGTDPGSGYGQPATAPPAGHGAPDEGTWAERSRRALDALHTRGLPDASAAVADRLIRAPADDVATDAGLAQRWMAVCGSPAYERAFTAMARDPQGGFAEFSDDERAAWRSGRVLQRALGEATSGGQFLVPVLIDPAILLSNAGSNNPIRQVSRTEVIATSAWNGVVSAGASSEWIAEAAEVADASPTLTQPNVPVFKGDSFVPFSFELEGDAQNLMSQLASVLTDAAGLLQNAAFVVGTGSGQPSGFAANVTQLTQAPTGAFVAAHPFFVQNALPPRFSANASWLANIAVENAIAQFVTTNGSLMFPEIRLADPQLLHKPFRELSDMSADMSTTGSRYLAYGSWRDAFLIVDRIGSSIELVQHLVGTNRRPTGQRGALLWFRTGSAVLVPNAARILVKA